MEKNPLELEKDYPYKGVNGHKKCLVESSKQVVTIDSYVKVVPKKIDQLKASIALGPTCVGVDSSARAWTTYLHGIFNPLKCGTDLDHAITAVGYGKEGEKEYFILRNSWSEYWGEKGYMRMAVGKDGDGVCGVLMDSSRPTF